MKVLLSVFLDWNGVVHHEFLPQGRMVNKEVMLRLCEAIRQKPTELWKNQSWIFQHVKPPAHTSLLVREFCAKNKTVIMPQPPYLSDLTLPWRLKTLKMKGKRFPTIEELK